MITLERAKKWDIPRVWLLYQRAFPAGERKPFSIILSMAKEGRTDLWIIRKNGRFAGLATTVNSPELVLLDYFAVCKSLRGQGVGSAAMGAILDCYAPRGCWWRSRAPASPPAMPKSGRIGNGFMSTAA